MLRQDQAKGEPTVCSTVMPGSSNEVVTGSPPVQVASWRHSRHLRGRGGYGTRESTMDWRRPGAFEDDVACPACCAVSALMCRIPGRADPSARLVTGGLGSGCARFNRPGGNQLVGPEGTPLVVGQHAVQRLAGQQPELGGAARPVSSVIEVKSPRTAGPSRMKLRPARRLSGTGPPWRWAWPGRTAGGLPA